MNSILSTPVGNTASKGSCTLPARWWCPSSRSRKVLSQQRLSQPRTRGFPHLTRYQALSILLLGGGLWHPGNATPVSETSLLNESALRMVQAVRGAVVRDIAAASGLNYEILRYFNVAGSDLKGRTGQSTAMPRTSSRLRARSLSASVRACAFTAVTTTRRTVPACAILFT